LIGWSFFGKSFFLSVLHGELGYRHSLLQAQLMSDIQLFDCYLLIERCVCWRVSHFYRCLIL
jgi:hypothetical protein